MEYTDERLDALRLEGDPLASDPSCSYQPSGDLPVVRASRTATYGSSVTRRLPWSKDAEDRISKIPSFVRGVVMDRLEDYARRKGMPVAEVERWLAPNLAYEAE